MDIQPILSAYFIPGLGLLFLMFFILYNPLFNKRQGLLFMVAAIINFLLLISTALDHYFANANLENYWIYRRITSYLNFSCSPVIPILLSRMFHDRKRHPVYYLPIVLNIGLCLASTVIPSLVFYITPQNTYGRGELFFVPITITIFYIILLFFEPITKHAKGKTAERVFLLSVIGVIFMGMALEIVYSYKFVMWGTTAIGLILYYLFMVTHYFLTDPLTGVLNRLMYNRALLEIRGKHHCAFISMDINDFKIVNDTHGHAAGDKVLQTFASLLSKAFGKTATVYRVGGDEFVIIAKRPDLGRIEAQLQEARRQATANNISFAYGIINYTPKEDLDEVLASADKNMYVNKAHYKDEKEKQSHESISCH